MYEAPLAMCLGELESIADDKSGTVNVLTLFTEGLD